MNFPEPYKRYDSKYYYFIYNNPKTGKRKRLSTKMTTKKEAREFIQKYIKDLHKGITDKTFAEYGLPFSSRIPVPMFRNG